MTGIADHGDDPKLAVRPVFGQEDLIRMVVVEEDEDGLMREVMHIDLKPEAAYVLGRRLSAHALELIT